MNRQGAASREIDRSQLLQRTASAASRDDESFPNRWSPLGHQEPKDRCAKQGRPGRPAPNLHGLRLLYYETNSDSERRLSPFEVSASWSNVRANQFPRPVNLAEPSRWFVLTVNIPSRARFAIVTPASLTASQISAQISWEIARTCRTSRQQSLADCVNRSAMEGCDRVGDVTLRPQRRRLGVGNHGLGQAFRI
jgi:hypothetical protein